MVRTDDGAPPRQRLEDMPMFAELSPDILADLWERLRLQRVTTGSRIVREGETGTDLYIVLSGKVGLQRGPQRHLLAVRGAGEVFGEVSVFDPRPWPHTAVAMTPVELARASRPDVLAWVGRYPPASELMLRHLARRLGRDDRVPDGVLRLDVPARVARMLLVLADRYATGDLVQHGLSQQQLGDIVGASREAVNKTLVGFTEASLIRHFRRGFLLLDRDALQERADLTPRSPAAV